jgi:hypothetical protein
MQPSYLSSYEEILARVRKYVRDQKTSESIMTLLQDAPENALKVQGVVLSRSEKEHLSQKVMKEVLDELMKKIDKGEHA